MRKLIRDIKYYLHDKKDLELTQNMIKYCPTE